MMKITKITFQNSKSSDLYLAYLQKIEKVLQKLPLEEKQDVLMELNSHIYECFSQTEGPNELASLQNVLSKIGEPKEYLKPLMAHKSLEKASKNFNPMAIFKALLLNLSQGMMYVVFFVLYLCLLSFVVLIVAKIIAPHQVGFYYLKGQIFQYGILSANHHYQAYEILGHWFIPSSILLGFCFYMMISYALKLKLKQGLVR